MSSASAEEPKRVFSNRVILTTYPGQSTVNPVPIQWGAADPKERGPIIVSRQASTISKRNAIGAHGGSYSVYFALANACMTFASSQHRADTEVGFWRDAL